MMVTANLTTVTEMEQWMNGAVGRTLATADEWCYGLAQLHPGACDALPDQVLIGCGMSPDSSNRSSLPQVSASVFLEALRAYQTTAQPPTGPGGNPDTSLPICHSGNLPDGWTIGIDCVRGVSQVPGIIESGGSGITGSPAAGTSGGLLTKAPPQTGQGLLGPTTCTVCQQLSSNPLLLVILLVSIYYLFFKK